MHSQPTIHKDNIEKPLYEQNAGTIYEIPNYAIESDTDNPRFLFADIPTKLLLHCANGRLDLQAIAKQQLANRGLDENGTWVGFNRK
jgi:hypothetical protein